jgi:hypothetical protein
VADYIPPSSPFVHNWDAAYTPPSGGAADHIFTVGGADQFILLEGFESLEASWVETVKWPQYASAEGFRSASWGQHRLHESFTRNHDFNVAYSPPPGDGVFFDFNVGEGEILVAGWDSLAFGSHAVEGTPEIRPSGIYQGVVSTDLSILLARRTLAPASIVASAYGTQVVSNFNQAIDLAGRSIVGAYGTAFVAEGTRYVYPLYVPPGSFGVHMVGRDETVEPEGFDASLFGTADVHDTTQWVHHHSGITAMWGDAWVSRSPRTLEAVGFPSTIELLDQSRWGRAELYNLTQYVAQIFAPGTEDGGVFGSYIHTLVENRNRVMSTLGHASSRVSPLATVENAAVAVLPPTMSAEEWGAAMVADAVRYVTAEGWEEFYAHPLGTALHNAARVLAPAGWESSAVGLAAWSNPPQDARFVGRIDEIAFGDAFVARAIRTLTVPLGPEATYGVHDVQLRTRYLEPAGAALPLPFGAPFVEERFTIFYPSGFDAYRASFAHAVANRNKEVAPYAYDQAEIGAHVVDLHTRYLEPAGIGEQAIHKPTIADNKQYVNLNGYGSLRMGLGHQVTKIPPDPPAAQTAFPAGRQWTVYGETAVRRNQIDCDGFVASGYGDSEVRLIGGIASSIDPPDPQFGTAVIRGPRYIQVSTPDSSDLAPPEFPKHDMKPRTIWATFEATAQAQRIHGGAWKLVDHELDLADTGERPFFGTPDVSLSLRGIAATGSSFGGMGEPAVDGKIRYLRPDGWRSQRIGIPKLPGPQVIDFLLGTNLGGAEIGSHTVDLRDKAIAPAGLPPAGDQTAAAGIGAPEVDFFHRSRTPDSWDSLQMGLPSPLDTRESVGLRVHPPEPYIITAGLQTGWGTAFISNWIRDVYPEPWVAFDMSSTPGQFSARMRVRHGSRSLAPTGLEPGSTGSPTVWQGTRHLYVDSIWRGNMVPAPDIRYQAIIALGGHGWDSSVFGDVQEWEAGKIKPQGEEHTSWGNVRTNRVMYASGVAPTGFGTAVVGPGANVQGWDSLVFGDPVMVYADGNEFLCGRRARALVIGDIDAGAFGEPTAAWLQQLLAAGWDSLDMRSWYAGEDFFAEDYHDPAYAVTVEHA